MYRNRDEAGQVLAQMIAERGFAQPQLLAVPRGGVVVAGPIAEKLGIGLEVLITRKIGHPQNEEVAVGAVMPDGSAVYDRSKLRLLGVTEEQLQIMISREHREIQRRLLAYTGSDKVPVVKDKTAIIVDDGIATGYTIKAAIQWLKTLEPKQIVVAVPVAPPEVVQELSAQVSAVICPTQPELFMAVGMHYQEFFQTEDQEVIDILHKHNSVLR